MKKAYPDEYGKTTINGEKMEWKFKRSKGESFFGIRGSRIFELEIKKGGKVSAQYERGWIKQIAKDDEETTLCLEHILNTYGKEKPKKRKEMGSDI